MSVVLNSYPRLWVIMTISLFYVLLKYFGYLIFFSCCYHGQKIRLEFRGTLPNFLKPRQEIWIAFKYWDDWEDVDFKEFKDR
jgi:hypothetical protein